MTFGRRGGQGAEQRERPSGSRPRRRAPRVHDPHDPTVEPARHPRPSVPNAPRPAALPCPHFPSCVGCGLIGTPYGEQLRVKRERVQAVLATYPSLQHLVVPELVGSPRAFGYRNQVKLVLRGSRNGLLVGIYRPESHRVVDIRACPVHHPLITSVVERAVALIERLSIPIYDERSQEGVLRYLVVRVSNWLKRAQIILVTHGTGLPCKGPLLRGLEKIPGVVSVVQNINAVPGNVIFGREFVPLTREAALIERVADLKLRTHAGAFLQANIPVARKLYDYATAQAALRSTDVVADLYCGAGALSFFLAAQARTVFGIEASPVAIVDAKANVRLNGFHNLRFEAAEAAAGLRALGARLPQLDVITLNPPRKGADAATREAIVAVQPRRVVYVSCDPQTLVRDLDWFAHQGYRSIALQPFDMLPQTEHVECVATLQRTVEDGAE